MSLHASAVETFPPPVMPAASASPSSYSPHSPSSGPTHHSIVAPSPVFQFEHSAGGSASSASGSPRGLPNNRAGSPFSHAASQPSTSTSLSSDDYQQAIRPSQEPHQLEQRPGSIIDKQLKPQPSADRPASHDRISNDDDDDDNESRAGGEGLGENFLNLGELSDDSDEDSDVDSRPLPAASLRSGLLRAVQEGAASSGGGGGPRLPPADHSSSPPPSSASRETGSLEAGRRQRSMTNSATSSLSSPLAPLQTSNRLLTPSSSADRLARGNGDDDTAENSLSSEGMGTLESMVDAMRQELAVSSPSASASSPTSFPSSPSDSRDDGPPAPLPDAVPQPTVVRRRKACLRCGCEVGGRTGKRFVAVQADEVATEGEEAAGHAPQPQQVLCEADWRELYLPKCRRCELAIESEAISSSDGQLRGKWHRACFTCWACNSPFETVEFHVWNDRPHCALCYHRLGGTLCQTCTRPIEGACAVLEGSAGQALRFHPPCLHCDRLSPSHLSTVKQSALTFTLPLSRALQTRLVPLRWTNTMTSPTAAGSVPTMPHRPGQPNKRTSPVALQLAWTRSPSRVCSTNRGSA